MDSDSFYLKNRRTIDKLKRLLKHFEKLYRIFEMTCVDLTSKDNRSMERIINCNSDLIQELKLFTPSEKEDQGQLKVHRNDLGRFKRQEPIVQLPDIAPVKMSPTRAQKKRNGSQSIIST